MNVCGVQAERQQMKRTREDLGSARRGIGGGRGIGKLESFVPLLPVPQVEASVQGGSSAPPDRGGPWSQAWGRYLLPPGRKGASIAHRPQATAPPGTLDTGQMIRSSRDGLTKELGSQGSMQTPQTLKGK